MHRPLSNDGLFFADSIAAAVLLKTKNFSCNFHRFVVRAFQCVSDSEAPVCTVLYCSVLLSHTQVYLSCQCTLGLFLRKYCQLRSVDARQQALEMRHCKNQRTYANHFRYLIVLLISSYCDKSMLRELGLRLRFEAVLETETRYK